MLLRKFALAALLPLLIAADQSPDAITPDNMRAHVEFLASNEMEGRETGTRGYDIAAQYVASQYRGIGLQPANATGWFQQVPFASTLLDVAQSRVTIGGKNFLQRKQVLIGAGRKAGREKFDSDVVFVGYGIDDPKTGRNDYAGLDVKGKTVAVLSGFPKGMRSDIGAHYSRTKAMMAEKHGATGIVNIRTLERERSRPWTREIEGPQHPSLNWTDANGTAFDEAPAIRFSATLGDDAAKVLFTGAPTPLAEILAKADQEGGRPSGFALKQKLRLTRLTSTSSLASPNVIGMLPGSDPNLANEHVLIMAHLDHVGIDLTRKGDQVFNGAMDNASGTAALLEAARALASSKVKPRRTIIFAAVTAEERGLLGSDYLARHAIIPGRTVGVVNLDMPILLYDFQDVIAFGAEHSTMGQAVARAGAKLGITLSPDPMPSEGLFTRSDHYSFVKQGVPSVFLMTGFKNGGDKQFTDFLKTHYHKVSDDLTRPFNWQAAAKFAQLNAQIAEEIANADAAPRWLEGSFFGDVFAPNQPKAAQP